MFDWFLLLAPALVALILLPFLFVGCASIMNIDEPNLAPTTLKLLISEKLVSPEFPNAAAQQQVVKVEVTWNLFKTGSATPPLSLTETITSQKVPPPVPPVLDPDLDSAEMPVADSAAKTHDTVTCECLVTGENGATTTTNTASMPLAMYGANVFRLHVNHCPSTEPQYCSGPPFEVEADTP